MLSCSDSGKIVESCYLSNWYELNLKSQKFLIILMERAKRPLAMHLYKLVFLSLESLAVIVQWSYSLFALIRAKYN
ncbi:7tm Odorant receptor [Popillia japonica]|uniref:7tm Odorant receptor n=1 Tax=Popillia japonica TaxID=7064 RepID=A0AAW1LC60_POPJA